MEHAVGTDTASRALGKPSPQGEPVIDRALSLLSAFDATRRRLTLAELSRRSGISQRSLQRLFQEYVGASPKWVIRRYRLHELVERLKAGDVVDGAQAALDLGYFDQAHLINDFRSIVGYSPARYGSLLRRPAEPPQEISFSS